jgi:RNA polymerase sigma factor (sigma-70 family)
VAQEVFLTAWQQLDRLDDPAAFGGWLLRSARNRAIDETRRRTDRPASDDELALLDDQRGALDARAGGDRVLNPADVATDRVLAETVWAAADGLGQRDALVVDLSLRHDLEPAEIAVVLDVDRAHAGQLVHRARGRLGRAVRTRLLWHDGDPRCDDLRAALARAGTTTFDDRTVALIDRHARSCDECGSRARKAAAPVGLFGAVPALAPDGLRARLANGLAERDVPMGRAGRSDGRDPNQWARLAGAGLVVVLVVVAALVLFGSADDDDPTEQVAAAGEPADETSPTRDDGNDRVEDATATTGATPTTVTSAPPTTALATGPTAPLIFVPDPVPVPPGSPSAPGGPVAPPAPAPPPPPPPADTTPPSVAVSHQLSAHANPYMTVTVQASDPSGISRIEIWFGGPDGPAILSHTCFTSPCQWTTPNGWGSGTEVKYRARAWDNADNVRTTSTTYVVIP